MINLFHSLWVKTHLFSEILHSKFTSNGLPSMTQRKMQTKCFYFLFFQIQGTKEKVVSSNTFKNGLLCSFYVHLNSNKNIISQIIKNLCSHKILCYRWFYKLWLFTSLLKVTEVNQKMSPNISFSQFDLKVQKFPFFFNIQIQFLICLPPVIT